MSTRLLYNKHHGDAPDGAVYIGRPSEFGNPFYLSPAGDRDACIEKFRKFFLGKARYDKGFREKVLALKGKPLVCYCYPVKCHGNVILDYLEGNNG